MPDESTTVEPVTDHLPVGERCASDIHPDRPAVVRGTFRNSAIRPSEADTPNVGYCAPCAYALHMLGWFEPAEGQHIPGEEEK